MSVALTADQTAYYRRKLGTGVDLTDVEARQTRLLGDQYAVVVEVLDERLATLISTPATFSVDGYSQSTAANIEATRKLLTEAVADQQAGADLEPSAVRIVKPARLYVEPFPRW